MRLTPAAELAVRGSIVLAMHHGEGPTPLKTICAERDLPKQYLTKLFSSLARVGLVTPVRGKHGGYLLAKEPADISLLDIIEGIEGELALNYCTTDPPQCEKEDCPVRPVWQDLQEQMREKLSSMSLQDVLDTGADICDHDVTQQEGMPADGAG
ncbi:MAG: RrF2 family transcriptional regulator [Phycisphaerae bacterium]